MSATLRTVTLGCKVNQYETEFVRQGLLGAGYRDAVEGEAADVCIANTCTVTADGDAKSRQAIRRLARENPQARIVVMGCYATRAPEEVVSLPGVVEVITDKREIPDLLGRWGVIDVPTGISEFPRHRRAFVKVQDGCLLRCAFCIIPSVRPHVVSRPLAHILQEAEALAASGFRELVLTGIHLGHYGVEQNRGRARGDWLRLATLVRALATSGLDLRIRLSSIEATEVTRELVATMAEFHERICPHLHVCLQSGSDAVLRRMGRRWGAQRMIDRCRLVQESLQRPALTTDIIVGFPGETDADFEETCRVAREIGFCKLHIFTYSQRRGTPAATMPDQIRPEVKAERYQQLLALDAELRAAYHRQLLGTTLDVLVEEGQARMPGHVLGTACRQVAVEFPGDARLRGQTVRIRVMESQGDRLRGEKQPVV